MSRIDSLSSLPAACAAAASAVSTALCAAADVAVQFFGVPLQVVLAALTGALGARVFLPPQPFWRAACMAFFWTFAGSFGAQLVIWLVELWADKSPPPGALAGIALVTAALGQRVAPIVWTKGGEALERRLDGLYKGSDRG
jgi:hypothetical protein